MEYAIIGACAAAAAIGAMLLYKYLSKKRIVPSTNSSTVVTRVAGQENLIDEKAQELAIRVEVLPEASIPDKSKLVEITDSKVLAHINNLIPGLVQAGAAVNNAARVAKLSGKVYIANIPAGTKLADSKAMAGAVRGIYSGPDGKIQGHANLMPVEVKKQSVIVARADVAIHVASVVVGQYYMTQINAELGEISKRVSNIEKFQSNEYQSRIISLMTHIKTVADFQMEILENNELRLTKIAQLDNLEEECTQLLGQANLTLAGYAQKNDLDYSSYEKELTEAQSWYVYQKSLLDVLYKISELRYTLYLGEVSREQCSAVLPTYVRQTADTQERLKDWHQGMMERLSIDSENMRRKRTDLDAVIHFIPGLINDDFNFQSVDEHTVGMIMAQISGHEAEPRQELTDLYAEDVQLIGRDGKVYYLPEGKTE